MRERFDFKEEEHSVILTVKTKSPTKWLLFDRETGQFYVGSPDAHWDRLEPKIKIDKDLDVW